MPPRSATATMHNHAAAKSLSGTLGRNIDAHSYLSGHFILSKERKIALLFYYLIFVWERGNFGEQTLGKQNLGNAAFRHRRSLVFVQKGQLQMVYPLHLWRIHLNVLRRAGFQTCVTISITYFNSIVWENYKALEMAEDGGTGRWQLSGALLEGGEAQPVFMLTDWGFSFRCDYRGILKSKGEIRDAEHQGNPFHPFPWNHVAIIKPWIED